ncbi:MAG: BON domain-containing protein [Pararhizobium sp.]
MRFGERDRPRPRRQEDYDDYRERDIDSGWPYDDAEGRTRVWPNEPYAFGTGSPDDDPNTGFHNADDRLDRLTDEQALRRDRMLRRPDRRAFRGGPPREQGPDHRGKGPRGYKRSDERIREDVSDRLTDEAQLDPSEVEVIVHDGEVTLQGQVAKRFEKRLAEDWAETVSGVVHVQNNIRVRQRE